MRDLLGVDVDLKDLLPVGYLGERLRQCRRGAARFLLLDGASTWKRPTVPLNVAIANRPRPPLIKKRYQPQGNASGQTDAESVYRQVDDHGRAASVRRPGTSVTLSPFYPPDRGQVPLPHFRLRLSKCRQTGHLSRRCRTHADGDEEPSGRLLRRACRQADRAWSSSSIWKPRNTIRILPYGLAAAQTVDKIGADKYKGPGLAVQWVEVEGPLHDTWPPESHRRIFGDLPQASAPTANDRNRLEVVSKEPEADAERILRAFARRAFRRTVTDDDVKPFVDSCKDKLDEKSHV